VFRDPSTFDKSILETIENHKDFIFLKGFQPNDIVLQEFFSAGIWLYPTFFHETYCVSAVEAQLAGCLCIVSSVGSLPEIVGNERGFVLNPDLIYGSDRFIEEAYNIAVGFLNSNENQPNIYTQKIQKAMQWAKLQNVQTAAMQWFALFDDKELVKNNNNNVELSFVINLERQAYKFEEFMKAHEKVNFPQGKIVRFDAADGLLLTWKDVQQYFRIKEHNYWLIPHENNAGIFGCAMSHIKCWQKVATDNIPFTFIFEDDCVPSASFDLTYFKMICAELHQRIDEWDFCFVGILPRNKGKDSKDICFDSKVSSILCKLKKYEKDKVGGGTHAYILNSKGAKKLLKVALTKKISSSIDWFLFEHLDDDISGYICTVPMFEQNDRFQSTIQGKQPILKGFDKLNYVEMTPTIPFPIDYVKFLKEMFHNPYIVALDYEKKLSEKEKYDLLMQGVNEIHLNKTERDTSFKQKENLIASIVL
jgi:GR25 family glycosyltransferase involved in LPS biosynthesis